jgi:hypothetical protein
MKRKQAGALIRHRTKESRELYQAVRDAGGTATRTSNGHWRVTAPDGRTAIVSSTFTSRRSVVNAAATIRKCAGLNVRI